MSSEVIIHLILITTVFFFILLFLLNSRPIGLCEFWYVIFLIIYILPNILFAIISSRNFLVVWVNALFVLSSIFSIWILGKFNFIKIKSILNQKKAEFFLMFLLVVLVLFLLGKYGFPKFVSIFDSKMVSALRTDGPNLPVFFGYLYNIAIASILPLLIALNINRNFIKSFFLCFFIVFLGMYGANRGPVLIGLTFLFILILFKFLKKFNFQIFILIFIIIMVFLSFFATMHLEKSVDIYGLIYWRTIVIPAQATDLWISYFSKNTEDFRGISDMLFLKAFSNSINYPVFFKNIYRMGNLNAGFISESYSRFGLFGSLFMGALFIFILKYLDFLLKPLKNDLIKIVVSSQIIYALNVELSVVLLTKGLILIIIFFSIVHVEK